MQPGQACPICHRVGGSHDEAIHATVGKPVPAPSYPTRKRGTDGD